MTGPATRGTERGTRAPSRVTGTQGAVGAVLVVLALGLALRLIIAYLLPGSGFGVDLGAFRVLGVNLASEGPSRLLRARLLPRLHARLSLRPVAPRARRADDRRGRRCPDQGRRPILADLAIGWLVWSMVRELGGRDRIALAAALVAVVNPISWFDSVVWGQVDSFGVVFLLLGLRELWRDRPGAGRDLHGDRRAHQAAARDPHPDRGGGHDPRASGRSRRTRAPVAGADRPRLVDPAWERRTDQPIRILTTGAGRAS